MHIRAHNRYAIKRSVHPNPNPNPNPNATTKPHATVSIQLNF